VRAANFLRIVALSAALSAYSAWVLTVRPRPAVPDAFPAPTDGLPLVELREARALWDDPGTVFLDVRSEADYSVGHIPRALHVPAEEVEKRLPTLHSRLQRASAIVVYCKSRDCGKSLWVALRLRNAGLLQTRIYPGGWNEWFVSDQPRAGDGQ
jgi:rhodanese-related sulfurtransferase